MTDEVEQELRNLIRMLSGYRKPIEAATSVNFDVGLDGDDGAVRRALAESGIARVMMPLHNEYFL